MKVPSFQHAVGFSVGDTLSLFLIKYSSLIEEIIQGPL